jgi:hypothetical protein
MSIHPYRTWRRMVLTREEIFSAPSDVPEQGSNRPADRPDVAYDVLSQPSGGQQEADFRLAQLDSGDDPARCTAAVGPLGPGSRSDFGGRLDLDDGRVADGVSPAPSGHDRKLMSCKIAVFRP